MKKYALSVFSLFLVTLIITLPLSGKDKGTSNKKVEFSYFLYGAKVGRGSYTISEGKNRLIIKSEAGYSYQGQMVELASELTLEKKKGRPLSSLVKGRIGKKEIKAETSFLGGWANGLLEYDHRRFERRSDLSGAEVVVTIPPFPFELIRLARNYDLKKKGKQELLYYDPVYLRVIPCYLELREELEVTGIKGKLSRFFFNLGNQGGYFFLDRRGDIYQISLPMSGLIITREDYEGRIPLSPGKKTALGGKKYSEQEVSFPCSDFRLSGTLTIPDESEGKKLPAVVLVSGSGPQNRDEDTPIPGPYGLKFGIFRTIAHHLGNSGFVVLRYDDIGIGESGGSRETVTLYDRINEVRSAVSYLQSLDSVDKFRIGIIGHSEGAVIAPEVAVRDPELAGIVLMGAPAKPLDYIIFEQSQAIALSGLEFELGLPDLISMVNQVQKGSDWGEISGISMFLGWFRSHFYYDPLTTISRVNCPILIVNGALDLQVLPANATAIALALEKAGKKEYTLRIFDGLDHLFMPNSYQGHMGEYNDFERELSPEFIECLVSWVKENI
jgi:fermentation-respiration switch protein FrsA (DUF1100 family)